VSDSPRRENSDATASRPIGERWVCEALRVYRRYQTEVVEALGLCPWAERARLDGGVRERVLLQRDEAIAPAFAALDELEAEAGVDVGLLIFPRLALGRSDFEHFVSRVREADVKRHSLGEVPFMFAAFHPDAAPDTTHAERLIPFLRRTPDPSIQLVRGSAVDRVRARASQGTQFVDVASLVLDDLELTLPLRERITRANLATAQRIGVGELGRHLDEIRRDRDETYEALGRDERAL
jgi:hypothetical protein